MANTIPFPTFNWKAQDQIRAWEIFEAKAKLWLAGEEIKKELQYTKIVLMLGEEGLNRWTKFQMTEANKKDPDNVFAEFRKSLGKDISYRTARATLYCNVKHYLSVMKTLCIRLYRKTVETETVMNTLYI